MEKFVKRILAFCLAAGVEACGDNTIREGDHDTVQASYESVLSSLADYPVKQKGFPLALYRTLVPGEMPNIPDNFDPKIKLPLAIERKSSPSPGSDEYLKVLQREAEIGRASCRERVL